MVRGRGGCTLSDGGDGEGAAQGGVLLAGDTDERLALRELAGVSARARKGHGGRRTEALMSDWENMVTGCVVVVVVVGG